MVDLKQNLSTLVSRENKDPETIAYRCAMTMFKALQISKTDDGQALDWVELSEKDLMEGDVTVKVEKTTVNYKDGLAITGSSPVVRHWPMVPGIDFSGTVMTSEHPDFKQRATCHLESIYNLDYC